MGFLSKLFGRGKTEAETKVGGKEDFETLFRVYLQAGLAAELNITNLNALPDLRTFKVQLRVPTQGGKLGVGERAQCKKMIKQMYQLNDDFFKEFDSSIRRNCRKIQDAQSYGIQLQRFIQDVMMLTSNLLGNKLRLPSFFKKMLRSMTEKAVDDIYNKNDFSDAATVKTVLTVRNYNKRLGFSQQWTTDFVFTELMLAKKEKQPQTEEKKS